jgi:hypothetical protein
MLLHAQQDLLVQQCGMLLHAQQDLLVQHVICCCMRSGTCWCSNLLEIVRCWSKLCAVVPARPLLPVNRVARSSWYARGTSVARQQ